MSLNNVCVMFVQFEKWILNEKNEIYFDKLLNFG